MRSLTYQWHVGHLLRPKYFELKGSHKNRIEVVHNTLVSFSDGPMAIGLPCVLLHVAAQDDMNCNSDMA